MSETNFFSSSSLFLRVGGLKTEGVQYSGAYASMGVDNSLRLDDFCGNFRIEVVRLTDEEIEFDMVGIDASLANAFRRILISEVCNFTCVIGLWFLYFYWIELGN